MELNGNIEAIDCRPRESIARLTLNIDQSSELMSLVSNFYGKQLDLKLNVHREKRSLDANAYLWVLVSKIAEAVKSSKDEIYLKELKAYGQQFIAKIPNKYTESFERETKYCEPHEKLTDEKAVYYRVYVGSSNYNTDEMSKLIDGVVSDAKELGIETMTPDEIAKMKASWGE